MAKQTKRILKKKNIVRQEEEREAKELELEQEKANPKHKPWEIVVLLIVICLTTFLLISGWNHFDNMNRGLYSTLLISLILMYVQRRHADDLKPELLTWVNRASAASIGLSVLIFLASIIMQYNA